MKVIEFFGLKVKPRITKGKHMVKPIETSVLQDGLCCIRDKDVNCFLCRTPNGYFAIDSGYKNSRNIRDGLKMLHISPDEIHTVLLTHLDIDHAGGMDLDAGEVFPRAEIYLSRPENEYLNGKIFRKTIGPVQCKMPIRLRNDRKLLADGEIILCDGVEAEAVYAPGHSEGHTVYRVGNDLFSGDCIISDGVSGWCFYDFWNWNTAVNKTTLKTLKEFCHRKGIVRLITSHSGMLSPEDAFIHCEECPQWREKEFQLIPDAEDDPYRETSM